MNRCCDFHTHTNFSDGSLTPEELVRAARAAGLTTIAITDHDITDGLEAAEPEAKRVGMEIIPGIELSAMVRNANGLETEMHVLGYFINHRNPHFQETLTMFRKTRLKRAEHMIAKLSHLGMKLNTKKIEDHASGKAVGRPHIARALVEAGHVVSFDEAFHKYLKEGRPAYVPKALLSPVECVQLIRRVGGLAVVAHPYYGGPKQRKVWEALIKAGLNGVEAHHSQQPPHAVREYERLAHDYGLLVTGGSDFHSDHDGPKGKLGDVRMPYSTLETMRATKEALDLKATALFQKV